MRIVMITAGAAGMYCGSCIRDNTLVAALRELGHDALLVPTYTPIRTDDVDVSQPHVFFGGINVYLEQKFWLFRQTPGFVDWLLNRPALLRWVSRYAVNVNYADLGALTVSMLRGRHGRQRKELRKLSHWLKTEVSPDVVLLTNALLSGIVPTIRQELGVPVLTTLQGDDIFLDALPESFRRECIGLIQENDRLTDGYICTSQYYADYMAGYLGLERSKLQVVAPGINLKGHTLQVKSAAENRLPTLGYFARICPEKGFHQAVDAYIRLRQLPGCPPVRFLYSGWLGANQQRYFQDQQRKLAAAGYAADCQHRECPRHDDKVRFFQSIDVLTVPTIYPEPKGLYLLESWANGVPVVVPGHGSFPEMIAASQAGVLVTPGDVEGLARAVLQLLLDPAKRVELGQNGLKAVQERYHARVMAENTVNLIEQTRDRLRESVSRQASCE